jgi:hypothetical protein
MRNAVKPINRVYIDTIQECLKGQAISARGLPCFEVEGAPFVLRLSPEEVADEEITLAARGLNYEFGLIEKLSYLSGVGHYPRLITKYCGNYSNFLEENETDMGAYGPRMSYQLNQVYHLLRQDPDTRQAVVSVFNHLQDNHGDKKNEPCTLALHFTIRGGALDLTAYMRSNDVWWGLPYDMSAFIFLQKVLARWLEIPAGSYSHVATSMHIYDNNMVMEGVRRLLLNVDDESAGLKLPDWDLSYKHTWTALSAFWDIEEAIRTQPGHLVKPLGSLKGSKFLTSAVYRLNDYWIQQKEG